MADNNSTTSESKYNIYNYFAEHIPVFITIITGIIASLSFLCNMLNYYHESKILYYWGWNPQLVTINITNKVYNIAIAWIVNIVAVVLYHQAMEYYKEYYALKKQLFILDKMVTVRKKALDRGLEKENQLTSSETIEEIIQDKKDIRDLKHELKKQLVLSLLLCVCFGTIVALLLLSPVYDFGISFWVKIGISLLYSMLMVGATWRTAYRLEFLPIKKKIEKAGDDMDKLESLCDETGEQTTTTDDTNLSIKRIFSDRNIKSVIFYQVLLIFFFYIVLLSTVNITQSYKKEFQVCCFDDKQYAIIYRDDKSVYLDRIEIDTANKALLDTTNQRIENVDGVEITNYRFGELLIKRIE